MGDMKAAKLAHVRYLVFSDVREAATAWHLVRRCPTATMALALLLLAFSQFPILAEDRLGESRDQDRAYKARHRGEVRSLDSVIANARAKGKVLDVQLKNKRYKVKILAPDGRVRTLDIDAGWGEHARRGSGGGGDDRGRDDSSGPGSGRDDSSGSGSGSGGHGGGDDHGGRDEHEGSGGRGRGGRR